MGMSVRGRTFCSVVASAAAVPCGGRVWGLMGDRDRGAVPFPRLSGCIGSVGMPCCEVKERVGRNTGRCAGSVALQRIVSPFLAGRILVRRMPRSVELHCVAVEVCGLVRCSQILIPTVGGVGSPVSWFPTVAVEV